MKYAYIQTVDGGLDTGALDGQNLMMAKTQLWYLMRSGHDPQTVVYSVELRATPLGPQNPRHRKIKQRLDSGRLEDKDLPAAMKYDELVIAGESVEGRKKLKAFRINPPTEADGLRTHVDVPVERDLVAAIFPLFPPTPPADSPTAAIRPDHQPLRRTL